jgi:hypothetical protein
MRRVIISGVWGIFVFFLLMLVLAASDAVWHHMSAHRLLAGEVDK